MKIHSKKCSWTYFYQKIPICALGSEIKFSGCKKFLQTQTYALIIFAIDFEQQARWLVDFTFNWNFAMKVLGNRFFGNFLYFFHAYSYVSFSEMGVYSSDLDTFKPHGFRKLVASQKLIPLILKNCLLDCNFWVNFYFSSWIPKFPTIENIFFIACNITVAKSFQFFAFVVSSRMIKLCMLV